MLNNRILFTPNGFPWGSGRRMRLDSVPLLDLDEDAALRTILEGTAKETGERFFTALVENLAKGLDVHGAMVTRRGDDRRELRLGVLDGRSVH